MNWPRPCAWNRGAGTRHIEPASIGTTLRNHASGSRLSARARPARPSAAPVVPEVRITVRPSSGGGSSGAGPARAAPRGCGNSESAPSGAAIDPHRSRRGLLPRPRRANSLVVHQHPWAARARARRRSSGADIDVFSISESAPSLEDATIDLDEAGFVPAQDARCARLRRAPPPRSRARSRSCARSTSAVGDRLRPRRSRPAGRYA